MTFVDDHVVPLDFAQSGYFLDDVFVGCQEHLEVDTLDPFSKQLSRSLVALED